MGELPVAFLDRLRELEGSYLREPDPVRQSGFGGGHERWRSERALVLDAVPDDGALLDVGCANGDLLECLVRWGHKRHIRLTPYGVDGGAQRIGSKQAVARDIATDIAAAGFRVAGSSSRGALPIARVAWIRAEQSSGRAKGSPKPWD